MFLQKLRLRDFRNYPDCEFEFTEKQVVFFGNNGRGKTNVLEAISVFSVGKSWRETSPEDLILSDSSYQNSLSLNKSARIDARISNNKIDDFYHILIEPRSRKFFRNEKKISLKSHFGNVPTILFCPEFLELFSGGKSKRQKFFDRFLIQISKNYRENLLRADNAHKNKVAILRREEIVSDLEIEPWNKILAETIPEIISERLAFLKKINPLIQSEFSQISETNEPIDISLKLAEKFEPTRDGILKFFSDNSAIEKFSRRNLIAIHRDDFLFSFRGKPVSATASRGEERSILIALLSAQKIFLKEKKSVSPILLLDDVFSELDSKRQKSLEKLCKDGQVFFTTTHESHFEKFLGKVQKYKI
jgi:DNA replication and repair protein RecF